MLACKHERSAFGSPMCEHLRVADAKGGIDYVRWYIGSDLDAELVCIPCAEKRKQGLHIDVVDVCEECFVHVTSGINCEDQIGSSNKKGLSRWSIEDGARTGHLPQFQPAHHHRGAGELAQLKQTVLERWTIE